MDLIDLSTPKPAHSNNNTFSPTLLRGLDECFKSNALKFAESDFSKTYKEPENTFTETLGSKRCPTTPLTPSLNIGRSSKRRILADRSINRSLPLSVNFKDEAKKYMKKSPIVPFKKSQTRRLSRTNKDGLSSRVSEQISLAISPDVERQIQVEMDIVQQQLKHLQGVADFIRLEKKFTLSP